MSESNGTSVLDNEEKTKVVLVLLKEYTDKLSAQIRDILDFFWQRSLIAPGSLERAAWLLDQGELLRKSLPQIISRGSALLEYLQLETNTKNELSLRMSEIEIHFHHMLRLIHELKLAIDNQKNNVAKLRISAGLNAMKGGPLRPD
jgi:hypothetical protein